MPQYPTSKSTFSDKLKTTPPMKSEELHALVERYRAILVAVPDIIMEVNTEKAYTWANQAGKRFFGEDVIGHTASDYFIGPQDTYAVVEPLFQGSEDTIYVESWQRRYDGEKRLLAWWCRSLKDENGQVTGSLSTARDITDERRGTEEICESEQRLRSVLSNMPILLDAFDENKMVIEWNAECERVTGYSAEEIVGQPNALEKLYPDADYREAMMAEWERRGNQFRNWEWDIVCKDGRARTIAWSNVSGIFPIPGWASWAVGVDVTDQKQAEQSLRESEAFLETSFLNAPYASWISDAKGTLLRINQACCNLLNITEEDVVDKYNVFQDNIVKEQGCMDLIRQVYEEAHVVHFELDYDMTKLKSIHLPSSNHRYLEVTISPILDASGNVINAIYQHVDITERKIADEKIRQLNQSLEQRVQDRTEELRRAVHLMAGREIRMSELKQAIAVLRDQLIQAGMEPMADDPLNKEATAIGASGEHGLSEDGKQ